MRCSQCGMEIVVPTRFCGYCGAELKPAGAAPSQTERPGQPFMKMVVGSEIDRRVPISGVMYVGREGDNEIRINDPRISRRHARLRADGTRVTIADLGSTNGTFVNDVPISGEFILHDGDLVRMGHSEWAYHAARAAEAPPRPAPRRAVEPIPSAPPYPRPSKPVKTSSQDIVEQDELPWGAIAIVVGGLIIGLSICCIAVVFILSR